jgi:hypothetical protein
MEIVERPDPDALELRDRPVVATPTISACREDLQLACRSRPIAGDFAALDLAAARGVIALLYTDSSSGGSAVDRAHVLLHDRALQPLGESTLATDGAIYDLALTTTADGWLVALAVAPHLELIHLDADGRELGPRQRVDAARTPRFAADPLAPAAPLLTWVAASGGAVYSGGVAPRGAWPPPARLFETTIEPNFAGQVAIAAGEFLVARRAGRGVEVARVSARGVVRSTRADVGHSTEYPTLVRCDDGPRMIWSNFASRGEVRWARLDDSGAVVGPEVRLSGIPDHFNHSPAICDGVDTMVLLAGYTGITGLSKSLDLVRVDGEGAIISDPLRIYDAAAGVAYRPTMRRDGDALVAAWGVRGSAQIALARVDLERVGPRKGATLAR